MQTHDIIVIGASAGSLDPLLKLVVKLPSDFNASVFILQHFPPDEQSDLADILSRNGPVKAVQVVGNEHFQKNRIYIAPPGLQLLLKTTEIILEEPLKQHWYRPRINAFFNSAATSLNSRVIGVILSGQLNDGAQGLLAVKQSGGISIVQEPLNALYKGMPESALELQIADFVVPASGMGALLKNLVS